MFELYMQYRNSQMYPWRYYTTVKAAWNAFHRMRKTRDLIVCEVRDEVNRVVAKWQEP